MADIIQIRRDKAANWTLADTLLALAEAGFETDTGKIKYGDGVTNWTSLPYFTAVGVAQLDNLSDVTISTATIGQALMYAGSPSGVFVNRDLVVADISDFGNYLVDTDIGVNVQAYNSNTALTSNITYEQLDTNGDVGTVAGTLAIGNHTHADYATKIAGINTQTGTSYVPVIGDSDIMITMDNVAANTVTIPSNVSVAYEVGTKLNFMQLGDGATSIAISTDTLNVNATLTLVLDGKFAVATALKVASTSWVLFGNLVVA